LSDASFTDARLTSQYHQLTSTRQDGLKGHGEFSQLVLAAYKLRFAIGFVRQNSAPTYFIGHILERIGQLLLHR
jgi:hypothetical protein